MPCELATSRDAQAFSREMQFRGRPAHTGCRCFLLTTVGSLLLGTPAGAGLPTLRTRGATVEINGKPTEARYTFGGLYLLSRDEDEGNEEPPPLPPSDFNPDPGVIDSREIEPPPDLYPPILPQLPEYGEEAVPRSLGLPRKGVREIRPRRTKLEYPEYPDTEMGVGVPPGDQPVPNRWFVGFGRWQRYADPSAETPYQQGALKLWHPYYASVLKADAPIFGEDIFLNLTVTDFAQSEFRRLPIPSGVSTARPNSSEFFGRSTQAFFSNDFQLSVELFKGETAFKPIEWAVRFLGVYNNNYISVQERNALDPDPRGSEGMATTRMDSSRCALESSRSSATSADSSSTTQTSASACSATTTTIADNTISRPSTCARRTPIRI